MTIKGGNMSRNPNIIMNEVQRLSTLRKYRMQIILLILPTRKKAHLLKTLDDKGKDDDDTRR